MIEIATVEQLRENFAYDGGVLRRVKTFRRWRAGDRAGHINPDGYVSVRLGGRAYQAHRVIWAIVHGEWPKGEIDHINGHPNDNRVENLRDVPHKINAQNQREASAGNTSGLLGVSRSGRKNKPWQAQVWHDGRPVSLGRFTTPEAAHAAYLHAKRELHPGSTI